MKIRIAVRIVALALAIATPLSAFVTGTTPAQAIEQSCYQVRNAHQYAERNPVLERVSVRFGPCRESAPWVVMIHGGSWIHGDRASMFRAAGIFYRHGFQVFNIDYRRGPHVSWPMQQRDVLHAYRWIVRHAEHFHLDLARGSAYGFSAGGHIAAWLGNQRPRLSSVVTVSGVLQPQRVAGDDSGARPIAEPTTTEIHNLHEREVYMMGCDWQRDLAAGDSCREAWGNFMPETSISAESAPVYMIEGELDPLVPQSTPDAYAWHLGQAGVGHVVLHIPGLGHTQQAFFRDPSTRTSVFCWIERQWPAGGGC